MKNTEYIRQLFPIVDNIESVSLRNKVIEAWLQAWSESKWERIETVPFNLNVEHDKCSLVQHHNFIAAATIDVGHLVQDMFHLSVNFDILLAGALLHDISKLVEYEPKGGRGQKTEIGNKITHAAYGAHIALNAGLPLDVVHLIISHTIHTTLVPCSIEGIILAYVDFIASDLMFHGAGINLLLEAHKK